MYRPFTCRAGGRAPHSAGSAPNRNDKIRGRVCSNLMVPRGQFDHAGSSARSLCPMGVHSCVWMRQANEQRRSLVHDLPAGPGAWCCTGPSSTLASLAQCRSSARLTGRAWCMVSHGMDSQPASLDNTNASAFNHSRVAASSISFACLHVRCVTPAWGCAVRVGGLAGSRKLPVHPA